MRTILVQPETDRTAISRYGERGAALLMAVFVLVLVVAMGTSLLFFTQSEVTMSRSDVRAKQAFYLAEAGLEDGRRSLFLTNGAGPFNDDLLAAAGLDGQIDFDPANVGVVYDGNGNITGFVGVGDDIPLAPATAFGVANGVDGNYIAFLTNDPADLPASPLVDSNNRVMITGVGVGQGQSVEVVQAIVERVPGGPLFPATPMASITMVGPTPTFVGPHNNNKVFDGEDCQGSGGTPGFHVPTVGVFSSSAETSVEAGWHVKPTYQSGPYSDHATIVDFNDSSSPLVHGPPDPFWSDCQAMHDMVEAYRNAADIVCPHGTETNVSCMLPAPSPDLVIFCDGDLAIGAGTTHEGTLVVTGTLLRPNQQYWTGMIITVGEGTYTTSGGGQSTISGGIIIAGVAGPDGVYGNGDDCTGGPDGDGFGIAEYLENGGGQNVINYCSDAIAASTPSNPGNPFYEVVEFLQR